MYTQCPECLTIYEIDEDALQASLGIVRCGHCDKRFDALRSLSDTLPIEPPTSPSRQEPAEDAPILTEAVPPSTIERAAEKRDALDTAAEPQPFPDGDPDMLASASEPPANATTLSGPSADDWFADMESELAASAGDQAPERDEENAWVVEPDQADATEPDIDMAFAAMAGDDPNALPSDADHLHGDLDQAPVNEDIPGQEALEPDASIAPFDPASTDGWLEFDAPTESPEAAKPSEAATSDVETGIPATPVAPEDTPPDSSPDIETPPAPVYVRPPQRFSRSGLMWTLGCVLLVLLLVVQLAWAERVKLLRRPATHAWMARFCASISCHLPLIKDTAKLELLSRDVRPNPNAAGTLTITATLRNDAAFTQPWPVIVVELTDLDNNPVAMRRFRPAEYMPDPARRAEGIAPRATAAVAFEVVDPGKRAVAFQFDFE
jgi:predicted Zn finger-like uncharacterized protein